MSPHHLTLIYNKIMATLMHNKPRWMTSQYLTLLYNKIMATLKHNGPRCMTPHHSTPFIYIEREREMHTYTLFYSKIMATLKHNKPRWMTPHHRTPCTPTCPIFALVLIALTYFFTSFSLYQDRSSQKLLRFNGRYLSWPERGYGSHLSLKIYIYDEDEINGLDTLVYGIALNLTAEDCDKGQWGTQVKIHKLLLKSRFRTSYKDEADLFFVPAYVKCIMVMAGLTEEVINQTYVEVISQMPYFRRSGGRDHIFVFPSGAGAHFFTSWETFINHSIFLTPEGDRTDRISSSAFNTWKDIIIPGNVNDYMTTDGAFRVHPLPLSKRKYLANYLGRAQGKLPRLQLINLAKQYPDKLECPDLKYDVANKLENMEYFLHLRNAKFCLVPRGLSSWTLRFYEAFFVECVPVILSDQIELPFQNVIDYTQFTIKWPATQIGPQLLEYLESISDNDIVRMIAHGKEVRCLWVYGPESEPCSAMHGILWELQRKVRQFQQSTETFWLHNGTVVNRNLIPFDNWVSPVPLP